MKSFLRKPISMTAVAVGVLAISTNVSADTYINSNGVAMSSEMYNNLLKIHTPEYISLMDSAKFQKLSSLDYDTVQNETIYVASTYNSHLGITTNVEVTEEEYNAYDPSNPVGAIVGNEWVTDISTQSSVTETNMKKLSLGLVEGDYYHYVTATLTWKSFPSTRSFDVIGVRGYGFTFSDGSQSGMQIYKKNGTFYDINYSWNGTNINRQSNGFGISMNLVDDTVTYLQNTIDCDVVDTISSPSLYASFQHATTTTTLAESKNYTLGVAGLGNVFVFPYSISAKYDGMGGTSLQF